MAENVSETAQPNPRVDEGLRIGPIVRDVIIVWVLTSMGGFVVGFAMPAPHRDAQQYALALAVSNILFVTAGFTIAGCLAPPKKWRHLAFVALGTWLTSIINIVFFDTSIPQWIAGAIFLAVVMGLGGAISTVLMKMIKLTVANTVRGR